IRPGAVTDAGRPGDRFAVMDREPLVTELDPAATAHDDEDAVVRARRRRHDPLARERELRHVRPVVAPEDLVGHPEAPRRSARAPMPGTEPDDLHPGWAGQRRRRWRVLRGRIVASGFL